MNSGNEQDLIRLALEEIFDHYYTLVEMIEDEAVDEAYFSKLFRIFHSIKGTAGVGGFEEISHVTHLYEDLVFKLKNDEVAYDYRAVSVLTSYLDWLVQTIDLLKNDKESEVDKTDICEELRLFIEARKKGRTVEKHNDKRKLKVLLVEDEENILELFRDFFTNEFDACVDCCKDGLEGEEQIQSNKYDMIVLDNYMPKKSGNEVLCDMRTSDLSNQHTPVLFVSAYDPIIENTERSIWDDVFIIKKPFVFSTITYYTKMALTLGKHRA